MILVLATLAYAAVVEDTGATQTLYESQKTGVTIQGSNLDSCLDVTFEPDVPSASPHYDPDAQAIVVTADKWPVGDLRVVQIACTVWGRTRYFAQNTSVATVYKDIFVSPSSQKVYPTTNSFQVHGSAWTRTQPGIGQANLTLENKVKFTSFTSYRVGASYLELVLDDVSWGAVGSNITITGLSTSIGFIATHVTVAIIVEGDSSGSKHSSDFFDTLTAHLLVLACLLISLLVLRIALRYVYSKPRGRRPVIAYTQPAHLVPLSQGGADLAEDDAPTDDDDRPIDGVVSLVMLTTVHPKDDERRDDDEDADDHAPEEVTDDAPSTALLV